MRHSIVLSALLCAAAVGCSAASDTFSNDPPATQEQAVTWHTATNGTAGLALPQGSQLCHFTYIEGQGAGTTDPNCGGSVSINSATLAAFPNACSSPPRAGYMTATARCVPLTAFGTFVPSQSFTTVPQNGQPIQSGTVNLGAIAPAFNRARACTLSGLIGHTHWDEYSWISADWTNWYINNHGPSWLGTTAECVTLGRAGWPVRAISARPGEPGTGIPWNQGECLLQEIHGGLNDGGVLLTSVGGNWTLTVWGSTLYARATCWNYAG